MGYHGKVPAGLHNRNLTVSYAAGALNGGVTPSGGVKYLIPFAIKVDGAGTSSLIFLTGEKNGQQARLDYERERG